MKYILTSKFIMNVRSDHNTSTSNIVGKLWLNQAARGDEIVTPPNGDQWFHALTVNGSALDGWIAIKCGDVIYSTVSEATPSDAQYAVVLSTFEQTGKSRPTLNRAVNYQPNNPTHWWTQGLPDTWQYQGATQEQNGHVVLTRELQEFWYAECVKQDPNHDQDYYFRAFNSLTTDDRWSTNGFGSRTCANYVTGANLDKEPMRFFTLLTGRATIKLLSTTPKRIYGTMSYPFACINANAPLDGISYETHPYLFYFPMNSVRKPLLNSKGKWLHGRVEYKEDGYGRFPQFDGRAVTPLFMPHTDVGWIGTQYVRLLKAGEPFPPVFNM